MMKRWASLFSLVVGSAFVLGSAGQTVAAPAQQNGTSRVLVQFSPGKKATVGNALRAAGGQVHYEFDSLNTIAVSVPTVALQGLSNNPNVVFIEEDAPRYPISITKSTTAATPSSTGPTVPYGIDMVQARDVWDVNRDGAVDAGAPTGANRKVCIIDSGFYTGHEDLQGVSVAGYNGNLPWAQDGDGHGTHVAGTIAAANNALGVVGVTPGTVQLYIVRVFGDSGAWAYSSTLVDAANRCASAGSNIISMSLGGGRASNTEKNAFASLNSQGILSIAAAGNDGTTALSYPASYPSVMSVAAIDANKIVADFSQKNSAVDIAAPGVGVLSTVPYLEANSVTVDGVSYTGGYVDFAARGNASGALVDGGLCDTVGAWGGKVVLCQRGTISFYDKVHNAQLGGATAAVLYNNVPGGFLGTLGDGNSSTIPAISISQEDGQFLVANKLGLNANVSSTVTKPASGYEYYDGTSMATPHASAVAALVWSAKPTATNEQVRAALIATAEDLGTAGFDNSYGNGLVRAKNAIDYLAGTGGTATHRVADLDATKSIKGGRWSTTVTVKVVDSNGAAVSGAAVAGTWSGAASSNVTCTTGTAGTCTVSASNMTATTVTLTITNVTKPGSSYNAAANSDPDGDSNGTTITVTK